MDAIGKPAAATHEEDAKIGETPATFANKLYLTSMPLGVKITFAETYRVGKVNKVEPRAAVFLQHQDVLALRQLLESMPTKVEVRSGPVPEPEKNG